MHLEAGQRVDDLLLIVVDLLHVNGACRLLVVSEKVGLWLLIEGELYSVLRGGCLVCFVILDEVILGSLLDDHLLTRRSGSAAGGVGEARSFCLGEALRLHLFVDELLTFICGEWRLVTPSIFVLLGTIGLGFGELWSLATEQSGEEGCRGEGGAGDVGTRNLGALYGTKHTSATQD